MLEHFLFNLLIVLNSTQVLVTQSPFNFFGIGYLAAIVQGACTRLWSLREPVEEHLTSSLTFIYFFVASLLNCNNVVVFSSLLTQVGSVCL